MNQYIAKNDCNYSTSLKRYYTNLYSSKYFYISPVGYRHVI